MRRVFVSLGLLIVSNGVEAALHQCTSSIHPSNSYLLVTNLEKETGTIFFTTNGFDWDAVYANAKAVAALDGGPLKVTGVDDSKTDWKKGKKCYRIKKATYRFTVNDTSGELQIEPNVDVEPRVICNVPNLARPAPVPLVCKDL